jgi:hypothetical protein
MISTKGYKVGVYRRSGEDGVNRGRKMEMQKNDQNFEKKNGKKKIFFCWEKGGFNTSIDRIIEEK